MSYFASDQFSSEQFASDHFGPSEIAGKSGVNRLYQIEQYEIQRRIKEEEEIMLFIKTILTKGLL